MMKGVVRVGQVCGFRRIQLSGRELRLLVKSVLWSFNCEQMFGVGRCIQMSNGYNYHRMRAADVTRDRRVADAEWPPGKPSLSKSRSVGNL